MKGLNLKGFKKVSSDEKTTTFRKSGGHEIRIAHGALSKDMQKQLDDLPHYDDGGEVTKYDDAPNNGYDLYHENENGQDADRAPASAVTPEDADSEQEAFDQAPPSHAPDATQDPSNWSGPVYNLGNQSGTNTGPTPPDFSQAPADTTTQQPSSQSQPQASGSMNPDLFSAGAQEEQSQLKQGMQGFNEGQQKEADLIGRAGNVAASEAMARNDAVTKLNTSYQQAHNDITQHRQDLISDIEAGHIDPKHYVNSMSDGKKVSTAIGLILGGIGGGITGQQNPALEFLNKQIDRDIEAQKADLGKKENLLSANFKQSGDLNDAINMTRVNMADIYATQLQRQAAQTQGPMAQARAQQAAAQLQMKVAPELGSLTQKVAMGKMIQNMQGQNLAPESKIQMYQMSGIMPQDEANKSMEELKSYQDSENVKNNILTAANKIAKMQTLGTRATDPIQSKQQIDNLNSLIKLQAPKVLGVRYNDEVAKQLDNLTAGITSNKITANQMQSTLNNIFGQKENYPYLKKWGLTGNGPKAFNSQGQSNFQGTGVK